MGESTSQIERDIMAERNELGRNLQLLENKARSLADWRTYFRTHPFAMMGLAVGGGVLLGALTKNFAAGEASEYDDDHLIEPDDSHYAVPSPFASSAERAKRQFGDTWGHIADALLAVASAKAIEFVGQKVPGFREQFSSRHPEHRGFSSGRNV
jgi:hypothetical protein